MYPNIPNSIYQIFIALALIFFYWAYSLLSKGYETYAQKTDEYLEWCSNSGADFDIELTKDSIWLTTKSKIKEFEDPLLKALQPNLDKNNILNLIEEDKARIRETDSIKLRMAILKINRKKGNFYKARLDLAKSEMQTFYILEIVLVIIGTGFLLLGSYHLTNQNVIADVFNKLQVAEKRNLVGYSECQSCCKVFSPMIKRGRESNGSENKAFCIHCYDLGKFTEPDLRADDVVNNITHSTKTKSSFQKGRITAKIHSLGRWDNRIYSFKDNRLPLV